MKLKKESLTILILAAIMCLPTISQAVQVKFSPRVTLSETYTDNVNLTKDDTEEDFITTVRPGFSLSVLGRKAGLDLSYDPSYSWYRENQDDNTFRHDARLNSWSDLTRNTRIFLNDSFIYTEDPYLENVVGSRTGRTPYMRNSATLGATHQLERSGSLSLQYTHRVLEYDEKGQDDSILQTPSASLSYWFSPQYGMNTHFSFTRGDYDRSDDFENHDGSIRLITRVSRHLNAFAGYRYTLMAYDEVEDSNYTTQYPNIGFDYQFMEDFRLSLSGGYLITDREEGGDDERFLASGNLNKTWRFKRGTLGLTGSSGYDESYFDAEDLGLRVYYGGNGTVAYEMWRDISARLTASHRIDDYVNTANDRQDRTTSAGAGLTYNRLRNLVAAIDYRYLMRNSSEDAYEYQENRLSFSLTLKPSRDILLK